MYNGEFVRCFYLFRGTVKTVTEYKGRNKFFLFGEKIKSFFKDRKWEYDSDGNLHRYFYHFLDKERITDKYYYDSQKRLEKIKENFSISEVYKYEENGQLACRELPCIKQIGYYKYDENGNLIELTYKDKKGVSYREFYFTNDEKGRCVEWLDSVPIDDNTSRDIKHHYEYDDNDRVIKETIFIDDKTITIISKYNEHGDVCESAESSSKNEKIKTTTYEYEYDLHGNWTKRVENGKKTTFREIEYF